MVTARLRSVIPMLGSNLLATGAPDGVWPFVKQCFLRGALLTAVLLLACMTGAPLHAGSVGISNSSESAAEIVPLPDDATDIPDDWLTLVEAVELEPALVTSRLEQAEDQFSERISEMDGENRAIAEAALGRLRDNAAALIEVVQNRSRTQPVQAIRQERYTLDEFLALRSTWRRTNALEESQEASLRRVAELESAQRMLYDQAVAAYRAAQPDSDEYVVAGLNRLSAGAVLLTYGKSRKRVETSLEHIRESRNELFADLEYARQHLMMNPGFPDTFEKSVKDSEIEQSVSARNLLQGQLVGALAETESDGGSALLNIKMKLALASARESLLRLHQARDKAKLNWHLLREGNLEAQADIELATRDAQELARSIRDLVNAWTAAGQATLVMPRPASNQGLDHVLFNEAQSAARDALVTLGNIDEVLDDLGQLWMLLDDLLLDLGVGQPVAGFGRLTEAVGLRLENIFGLRLFYVGDTPVTVGSVFKFLFIIFIGFAISWVTRFLLSRIQHRNSRYANSSSIYTLGRILHYLIITIAVLAAFAVLGLDIRSLALIAGALSVGIGFGLQSIVNNFLSGLILLTEGSLRVGDFVELDSGVTGVVREIKTRYTRINTNDNLDVVVPNSELVSYKLTNWTLKEPVVRLGVPFSVAYDSDPEQVVEAATEAAIDVPYTIKDQNDRAPVVLLSGFGESSLDFELKVWVKRSGAQRPGRVRAAYRRALVTRLKQHEITIPFPQRDLYIHGGSPLPRKSDDQD